MQTSVNPATGKTIREYTLHTPDDVQRMIAHAHRCYLSWREQPIAIRAEALQSVAAVLTKNKDAYARLVTEEMGKPLVQAMAEVEKCASTAKYYAEKGPAFLADEIVATEYKKSYVTFQPLGIILGVMPWNFPLWQVFRFALPSILAGNVGLLKHASNTPGSALAIESVFKEAGLPDGIFQSLLIPGSRVEEVIADSRVAAVTLTGSTPAGRAVAAAAGKHLKKTVLELGGSDAYLILADADVEHAVKTCVTGRLFNAGQSCVSAKRLIVVPEVKQKFEDGLLAEFRKQILGDPLDPKTTVGPMSRADLRDELHEQVRKSIKAGAKCLTGGEIPKGEGAFYPPTLLTDVKKGVLAYEEEIFGPVGIIIPARDEEDAIAIANGSQFGLGGAVFTKDIERGNKIARERMESGTCVVNMVVRSDPRLPFGGVKESGYGRELSAFGLREFVNIKTVVVA
jgi:succinate-semialdehyde dehydrogenase / glutarate-semialdehyde dehydrogenase